MHHTYKKKSVSGKFIIKLKHHLNRNLTDISSFSRVSLLAINKCNLKNAAFLLHDNLNYSNNSIYCQWSFIALLDVIESKIFRHILKHLISKTRRKTPTNINKGVELVKMPCIIHD